MSRLYLGVDGGQSSTKALIGDAHGTIVGAAVAGACNHVTSKEAAEKFRRVIGSCVASACLAADIKSRDFTFAAVCLGLSGGPDDKVELVREVIRSEKYKVTHDAEIALTGAHGAGAGIIAIAGTGSMVFGRNESGRTARAGGWGYVFGDEGSAFGIVRRALRAVLKEEEGWGPRTSLSSLLFDATNARTANDLMHLFYTPAWPRDRVGTLAPLVSEAAEAGDAVALGVLEEESEALAHYVTGVHRSLFRNAAPVAPIGGVFKSRLYRSLFATSVARLTHSPLVEPKGDPATGALREAIGLDRL